MAHQSDNAVRLPILERHLTHYSELAAIDHQPADIYFLVLPFGRGLEAVERSHDWFASARAFAERMRPESVLAILTSAADAAVLWPELNKSLHFQLWIALKLDQPRRTVPGALPEHHAALLILSKYRHSLRHTKTRIGYSYCPACDKTTKDYGGKKHTYHAYGTLMSDVWRDLPWNPDTPPHAVAERLADLFGLAPHRRLQFIFLDDANLQPKKQRLSRPALEIGSNGKAMSESASRLLQGDSLQLLRLVADASVDFCFADPPYNLAKQYDTCDDALDNRAYFRWCDEWLDELARVLKPGCTCAVLNIPQYAIRHFTHLRQALRFQNWIVWEGLSLPVRMIMPAHYSIVCFSKGGPRPLPGLLPKNQTVGEREGTSALQEWFCGRSSCVQSRRLRGFTDRSPLTDLWWDIHRLKHNSRRVEHPCQLPPALMNRLIALFTNPNELVLDPFNGAGTTTLCAAAMGRRYLGMELSEPYHRLAVERHQLLDRGGNPFAKVDRVPQAKNNRVKRIGAIRYEVSKKTLQLEVRAIAKQLGRLPTRAEVEQLSRYPIRFFDQYFLNWAEVCAAARTTGMKERKEDDATVLREPTLFDLLE